MFDDIHKAIRRIPKGKVATYGSVAKAAGHPGASRQVVWALRAAKPEKIHLATAAIAGLRNIVGVHPSGKPCNHLLDPFEAADRRVELHAVKRDSLLARGIYFPRQIAQADQYAALPSLNILE